MCQLMSVVFMKISPVRSCATLGERGIELIKNLKRQFIYHQPSRHLIVRELSRFQKLYEFILYIYLLVGPKSSAAHFLFLFIKKTICLPVEFTICSSP